MGDDIVLGHEGVASAYLALMDDLGVDINLSKSVISRTNSFEFAKRSIVKGVDLSPIGPKALLQSVHAPSLALPLIMDVLRREGRNNLFEIISIFQHIPFKKYKGLY